MAATQKPLNLEEEDDYEPMYPSDFDEDLELLADHQPQHFDDDSDEDECVSSPPSGFEFVEEEQEPLPGVYFYEDDDGEFKAVSIEGFGDSDEGIKVLEVKGNVETVMSYYKIDDGVVKCDDVCDNDCLSVVNDQSDDDDEEVMVFECKSESKRKVSLMACGNKKRKASIVCDECDQTRDARKQEEQAGIVMGLAAPLYCPWRDRNGRLKKSRCRVRSAGNKHH